MTIAKISHYRLNAGCLTYCRGYWTVGLCGGFRAGVILFSIKMDLVKVSFMLWLTRRNEVAK
jgi:hypothetical protein